MSDQRPNPTQTPDKNRSNSKWKVVALVNLTLGAILWFLHSTGFSLVGTIPDILFPPLAGVVGLVSVVALRKAPSRTQKIVGRLLCLPSIIGSVLCVLSAALFFLPPFTLGAMFNLSEIGNETRIQEAVSPDGKKIASVYFRPVGAYSGGNGKIHVRIKYRFFPVVEREVFFLRVSRADKTTSNYLKWASNDSLYISEVNREIPLPKVRLQVPAEIQIPLTFAHYLPALRQREIAERKLTSPVNDVPIYAGPIKNDQSRYDEERRTTFRSFNIPGRTPDEIVEWYRDALSKFPWTLLQVDRHVIPHSGVTSIRCCLQTRRQEGTETVAYFWEVMGQEDGSHGVHVNIGTPNPITSICAGDEDEP
jgi:hypothetical protein